MTAFRFPDNGIPIAKWPSHEADKYLETHTEFQELSRRANQLQNEHPEKLTKEHISLESTEPVVQEFLTVLRQQQVLAREATCATMAHDTELQMLLMSFLESLAAN